MQGAVGANLAGKRLQLMKQAMPTITRIGFLFNPKFSARNLGEVERVAPTLGLVLRSSAVRLIEDVKPAITSLKSEGVEAVDVDAAPPLIAYQPETVRLALDLQLPTASEQPEFAEDGGLLSYGLDFPQLYRQAAVYVDRILRGEKPGDLPVQAPTKYELVINLKTAKALGLTVPLIMQMTADEVIE